MKDEFFVILEGGQNPRFPHPTYQSARLEAERLSVKFGKNAKVVKTIAECKPTPPVVWIGEEQEIIGE